MADHLDLVAHVVEHQQCVHEEEHRLRQPQRVAFRRWHRLEVADDVVGYEADRAAVEAGQSSYRHQGVPVQLLLNERQGIHLPVRLARPRLDNLVRLSPNEAVSGKLLSALHAL